MRIYESRLYQCMSDIVTANNSMFWDHLIKIKGTEDIFLDKFFIQRGNRFCFLVMVSYVELRCDNYFLNLIPTTITYEGERFHEALSCLERSQ